jgi:hypothetical protein
VRGALLGMTLIDRLRHMNEVTGGGRSATKPD